MDILEEIIITKQQELERMRQKKVSMREALLASPTGIIAEFKRRSPSKGWIKEEGKACEIPLSYQQNGAAALSILTDKQYFGGHDRFIMEARQAGVTIPVLYKNFVIDEMQLYEALLCGASAVLLIAACLTKEKLRTLLTKAHELGLEVLLEMHDERELEYAELNPDLCGINNRHLGSFITDVETSYRLAEKLPREAVKVSESGISNPQTVRELREAGSERIYCKDMKVKVCGMRDGENIRQVSKLGVDYIGMIFWEKSPRNVTMIPSHAGIIPDTTRLVANSETPSCYQRVGVFVDEMAQNIITRVVNFKLDVIQLHGHEEPTLIRNLRSTIDPDLRRGIQIWKAISIMDRNSIAIYKQYEDCVDAFVFDTKCTCVGGSGKQFDWSVLDGYDGEKPFLLSGGIGPDDAARIRDFKHPKMMGIDLNSRFETEPGMKNVELLKQFLTQL